MIETNQVDDNDYSLILDEDLNKSKDNNVKNNDMGLIARTRARN